MNLQPGVPRPTLDVERARSETPGCEHRIHFNNAGAALMPNAVVQAQNDHIALEARLGGYEAAEAAVQKIQRTYQAIAQLIGARSDEIALMDSATRGWQLAFHSLRFGPGDRILTGRAEYASNYINMLQVARRSGAEIVVVPDDKHGQLNVEALERSIDERVKLIAITHMPSTNGLVNPIEAVGSIADQTRIPYLVDACQSVGQTEVNVGRIHCDFLVGTGRKYLRGPRGSAFLYVRRRLAALLEPPMLELHGAEWSSRNDYRVRPGVAKFESFECSVAARIGLGVAAEYAMGLGLPAIEGRVGFLAATLRERLSRLPGVTVHDRGRQLSGIVTFSDGKTTADQVRERVAERGINVWVVTKESARLNAWPRGVAEVIRASVHYYNDEAEIERFVTTVAEL